MPVRQFVLLDRDGTINVERHYLSDPDQLELLPGAAAGLCDMLALGLGLVIVTNQSGIARGYFDQGRLSAIHARLWNLLERQGVEIDAIYVCPHSPSDNCACRKPLPGLARQAQRDFGFDPARCFMIGDKPCDIELSTRLGSQSLLVRTGYGATYEQELLQAARDPSRPPLIRPGHVVDNLVQAAAIIRDLMTGAPQGNRRAA